MGILNFGIHGGISWRNSQTIIGEFRWHSKVAVIIGEFRWQQGSRYYWWVQVTQQGSRYYWWVQVTQQGTGIIGEFRWHSKVAVLLVSKPSVLSAPAAGTLADTLGVWLLQTSEMLRFCEVVGIIDIREINRPLIKQDRLCTVTSHWGQLT